MYDIQRPAGLPGWRRIRSIVTAPLVASLLIFSAVPATGNEVDGYGLIIIEKQTRPQGAREAFHYIGAVEGTLRDDDRLEQRVPVGLHSVTELMRHHWFLADIICDDRDSWADLANDTAWIQVDRNEHVTCVFYNQRAAEIIVKKVTDPPDSNQTFNFTGDLEGQIGHNDTLSKFVRPGIYNTTEEVPPGWNLTAVVCDHRRSWGDTENATAHYHVRSGERHTCTFYNEEIPEPPPLATSTLIVRKIASPLNSPVSFNFTGAASGSIRDGESIIVSNLTAGTYNVTEEVPPDWKLDDIGCDDGNSTVDVPNATATFRLEDGETVTCTWVNVQNGTIILEKQTVPDGSGQQFEFQGALPGFISDGENLTGSFEPYQWYQMWEIVPHGWRLGDIECNSTIPGIEPTAEPRGAPPNGSSVFLLPGQTFHCVFPNVQQARLILEKQTRPDGAQEVFNFDGDLQAQLLDDDTMYWDVDPGLYNTTELVPEGWVLASIRCDDGDSIIDLANATVTYNASAGETIRCVFFDLQLGKIIAHKVADPEDTNQTFNFTGDLAGAIGHNGTIMDWVFPGRYHVFEDVPEGWNLTAVECDSDGSSGNATLARAAYRIRAGWTVTCTFYNSEIPPPLELGTIIVAKNTDPDGAPDLFNFTGDVSGDIGDGGFLIRGGLLPGTYNVTEHPGNHWKLTGLSCDDNNSVVDIPNRTASFVLEEGETITCTFNNTQDGKIIIEKQTLPDGSPQVFEFVGDLAGNLSDGEMMMKHKRPGHYRVDEIVPHGWYLQDVECRKQGAEPRLEERNGNAAWIRLFAGETVHCVFTNQQLARIIVEKRVRPNSSPEEFNFTGDLDGILHHGESMYRDVVPGNYTTTEALHAGWALIQIACNDPDTEVDLANGTVTYHAEAGETLRCTFYNLQLAKLIAKKVTNPADSNQTFNFTGALAGNLSHNETLWDWVRPGAHHVFEETPPEGWVLTAIECDDKNSEGNVSLGRAGYRVHPGQTVTCTFFNDQSAKIIVKKNLTTPSNETFLFDGALAGSIGHNETLMAFVPEGFYNVTELPSPHWSLALIDCDDNDSVEDVANSTAGFNVTAGEVVTCTFTNRFDPPPLGVGALVISKVANGTDDNATFPFTGDVSTNLTDGGLYLELVDPGTYNVTENATEGWVLEAIVCDDGNSTVNLTLGLATYHIEDGETVTCTFYNQQVLSLECPRGHGYWKTHEEVWPVDYAVFGGKNYTKAEMLTILNTAAGGDASVTLAYQVIAALLNIAAGTDPTEAEDALDDADDVLDNYGTKVPIGKANISNPDKTAMNAAKDILESYNEGELIEGCDDED